ncbi:type 2 periplasmic-binding domain-containing protein [Moritella yayanosii]|nr:hypothetical protein [Moritella yayanosii]
MIEKNTPDMAPEFWTNQIRATLAKGGEEGRIVVAGDYAAENFLLNNKAMWSQWVPKNVVKKVEIALADL